MVTQASVDLIVKHATRLSGFQFIVDDANREAVTTIGAWLAREPKEGLDLGKGLLLIGNVGSGKTLLMRAMREAMMEAYGKQFGIRSCPELVRDFNPKDGGGYEAIQPWMDTKSALFDDLGAEGEAMHMGLRTNLMAEVIEARYEHFIARRIKYTLFTTNLGTDAIAGRYQSRAYSRLGHLCNIVPLGTDLEAADRRIGALVQPMEADPVSADNIYESIHPDIATKLLEAFPRWTSKREPVYGPMRKVPTLQEDVADFKAKLAGLDRAELERITRAIERRHAGNLDVAAPWLLALDDQLDKLSNE